MESWGSEQKELRAGVAAHTDRELFVLKTDAVLRSLVRLKYFSWEVAGVEHLPPEDDAIIEEIDADGIFLCDRPRQGKEEIRHPVSAQVVRNLPGTDGVEICVIRDKSVQVQDVAHTEVAAPPGLRLSRCSARRRRNGSWSAKMGSRSS